MAHAQAHAYELYIPPCIDTPPHPHHLPALNKPLRIQIEGPLTCVEKLFPDVSWNFEELPTHDRVFPQPAGLLLARLTSKMVYGEDDTEVGDKIVVRDEYLGWVREVETRSDNRKFDFTKIDYYGVTFDYLVPPDDADPEVLQINMLEIEYDDGAYANAGLRRAIDPAEYIGKKVLAYPRCCQKRKGTTDRGRVNDSVVWREERAARALERREAMERRK